MLVIYFVVSTRQLVERSHVLRREEVCFSHPEVEPDNHVDFALFPWLIPPLSSSVTISVKPSSPNAAHQFRTTRVHSQEHVLEDGNQRSSSGGCYTEVNRLKLSQDGSENLNPGNKRVHITKESMTSCQVQNQVSSE
ncbi:hypothetical protein P7K49_006143 [Saguinus oedipus]|uniref:Uncharacterized protein n=1 Tax=Saguinus oedipus TaxID=9490 RepID=A0ABQ9W1J9_SAGOE|nr:hypothetical protein P7K49_006143 [Saguinus oedipus]